MFVVNVCVRGWVRVWVCVCAHEHEHVCVCLMGNVPV